MLPVKAIAFDLDNTLVPRDIAFARLLTDWMQNVNSGNRSLIASILELDDHGNSCREELFRSLERMNIMQGDHVALWNRFRTEFPLCFEPDPELLDMMERLRSKGVKLAVLTNGGTELQRGKLKQTDLERFFDRGLTLISGETGLEKPDPAAFKLLITRLQCDPGEILFVGDHPDKDIRGAAESGMQTCWVESENYQPPGFDFSIIRMLELESILWPTMT